MRRLNVYAAIGKGRPVAGVIRSRSSVCRLHRSACLTAEDETNSNKFTVRRTASRADRLNAASNEIQSLYESSTTKSNSTASGSRFVTDSSATVTAPASLKEKLKQRAAQRVGSLSSEVPKQPSITRLNDRERRPERSSSRSDRTASLRSRSRPERRKKRSRQTSEQAPKDKDFVGHEYNGYLPDEKNVQLLERVLQIQSERAEKKLPIPTQYSEFSEEEQALEDLMKTRAVKPDPNAILEGHTGVNNERLGSGLGSQEYADRLIAMAWQRSKRKWAAVHIGEDRDVNALADVFKAQGDADISNISENVAVKAVLDKWLIGSYQPPKQDASEAINHALRAVSINKSYTDQDTSAFMEQFKKIVGSPDPQPKGKVREAVKAGAREAALSAGRRNRDGKVL